LYLLTKVQVVQSTGNRFVYDRIYRHLQNNWKLHQCLINEVLLKAIHVVNNTSTVVYLLNRSQAAVNNFLIAYKVNYQTLSRLNMVGKPLRIMHEINTDKITSHCIRQVVNPTRQHGKLDNVSLPAVKQNW